MELLRVFRFGFGHEGDDDEREEGHDCGDDGGGVGHFGGVGRGGVGEGEEEPCHAGAEDAAADVGGEAFAGAAEVDREDARDVVAPEAELADEEDTCEEDAPFEGTDGTCGAHVLADPPEEGGDEEEGWDGEEAEEGASAGDVEDADGEEDAAEEPADFLPFLDDGGFFFFDGAFGFAGDGFEGVRGGGGFPGGGGVGGGLLDGGGDDWGGFGFYVSEARDDLGEVLDGTEGDAVAAGEEGGGGEGGAEEAWGEEFGDAGAFEETGGAFGFPDWGFREEWPDDDEGDGWDEAGDECVAPCLVVAVDGGEGGCGGDAPFVDAGDEEATEGGEGLGEAEDLFLLFFVREEFCEPCDGGDEFDADADEDAAAEGEEHGEAGGVTSGAGAEGVEEDAPCEDAAAAEAVGEPAAEEAEDTAGDGRDEEEEAGPFLVFRGADGELAEGEEGGLDDQRQHEEFVDVEREADAGDDADEPLSGSETGSHGKERTGGKRSAGGGNGKLNSVTRGR